MAAEHPEAILGLPGIQISPGESPAATGILTRAINPTGAQHRPHRHRWPVDHQHIQEGPAQGIQRRHRTAAEPGQLIGAQLPVLNRLGLDPGALTTLRLWPCHWWR